MVRFWWSKGKAHQVHVHVEHGLKALRVLDVAVVVNDELATLRVPLALLVLEGGVGPPDPLELELGLVFEEDLPLVSDLLLVEGESGIVPLEIHEDLRGEGRKALVGRRNLDETDQVDTDLDLGRKVRRGDEYGPGSPVRVGGDVGCRLSGLGLVVALQQREVSALPFAAVRGREGLGRTHAGREDRQKSDADDEKRRES